MRHVDPKMAGFWLALWFLGLMILALMPADRPAPAAPGQAGTPQVYYSHAMTSPIRHELAGPEGAPLRVAGGAEGSSGFWPPM